MDTNQFDDIATRLTNQLTRRRSLGLLGLLGLAGVMPTDHESAAKKKRKKKGKKKKPTTSPPSAGPIAYTDASCGATGGKIDVVRAAQTFRALRSGKLTSATVFLLANSSNQALDLEIWSVDGTGKPSAVLAGTTISNIPAASGTSRPVTATFAGPATVVAGLRYALVTTSTNGNLYRLEGSSGDPCPDGQTFQASSAQGPFTAEGTFDIRLQTVVTA